MLATCASIRDRLLDALCETETRDGRPCAISHISISRHEALTLCMVLQQLVDVETEIVKLRNTVMLTKSNPVELDGF